MEEAFFITSDQYVLRSLTFDTTYVVIGCHFRPESEVAELMLRAVVHENVRRNDEARFP